MSERASLGRSLRASVAALALLWPCLAASALGAPEPVARKRSSSSSHATQPDAGLYHEAQASEGRLRGSARKLANKGDWEAVVLRYRKVVARYPRSGYCDNALLAVGNLYREMSTRVHTARYRADAVAAYRMLVAEYPSSSLGDAALWATVELARDSGDRRAIADASQAYLDAYPDGRKASRVKALMRQRSPASPLPSPPPPGLARVFDLRFWSGESSTRVVLDLERKLQTQSDLAKNPDRLWIDLLGARLHPNLARRVFPVGDGLLEQVRIAPNRPDVVRVVLDFKDVFEHRMFYLDNPPRLVIDVRGRHESGPKTADAHGAEPGDSQQLPARPVDGLATPATKAEPGQGATVTSIAVNGLDRPAAGASARAGAEGAAATQTGTATTPTPPPQPPVANRAGSYSLARQLGLGARRIVIDAGHGGHDPGTIGRSGLQEKDIVLDVALRLARLVRQELGAEVVLTRSTDVFVPLEERTAIANSREADLFLSIHANSSPSPRARGIETYFLNFARSAHAEAVAARENAISAATLKDLQNLVKAITLNSKIEESRDFATALQEGMVDGVRAQHPVPDRGVHTAPFYVLIGANMPAVLAEIAFVSNPDDEKRLKSAAYRQLLARSLLGGVRQYLEALNRTQTQQLTEAIQRPTVPNAGTNR
jgi:N-acetylmuramoyl-L-alanine amidase